MKICKNCSQELDKPIEHAEEKLEMAIAIETGKIIYYAILDKRFLSIDLCNWCYALLKAYKYSLKIHKILTEQEKVKMITKLNSLTRGHLK